MTIKKFERQLKKANPKIRIRVKGIGDVCGVFYGNGVKTGYIARFSKGELHLNGWREMIYSSDPAEALFQKPKQGLIRKRGRKTLLNLLWNRGVISYADRSKILWGIKQ